MATSKAAWRAYENLSEPRTPSQWVWLGRSTPMWWEAFWVGFLNPPGSTDPPEPFPGRPGPLVTFQDHAYLVQHNGGNFDALAWRGTFSAGPFDVDLAVLQWQEAAVTRSCVNMAIDDYSKCWVGQTAASQRDARLDEVRMAAYGQGTLFGGSWTFTRDLLANGFGLSCVRPAWSQHGGIFDMTSGTMPTSLILTYL